MNDDYTILMSPKIHKTFWKDEAVETLDPAGKLALVWLLTECDFLGLCRPHAKQFALDTGLDPLVLPAALGAMEKSIVRFGPQVWLKNFIRHQFGSGSQLSRNNVAAGMRASLAKLREEDIQSAILVEYPELGEGLAKPSKGDANPSLRGKDKDKAKDMDEVLSFCQENGFSKSDGEWFFHKCVANDWTNGGRPIKDWRATLRAWRAAKYLPSQKGQASPAHGGLKVSYSQYEHAKSEHARLIDDLRFEQVEEKREAISALAFQHKQTMDRYLAQGGKA